jgi:CheY-like chemotaxis protein/DNA-binding CsgD family transcriptional regulator
MTAPEKSTILVVDDTPANLAVLTDLLDREGFEVVVARDGAGALDRLRTLVPALILLDVLMPGLGGFETCRRLKADPRLAEVPVFFITAQTESVDKLEGFAAGAVDYITKPFFADEVLARVRAHLRIRELQAEVAEQLRLREEAEAQLAQSLDRAVAVVAPDGALLFCTALARGVLDRWFPGGARERVPPTLATWLATQWSRKSGTPAPFHFADANGEVSVRLLLDRTEADSGVLLLDEQAAASPRALRALGLTAREAEVLHWLTEGKTYREIGIILACEWRTAQKHAENIYRKLNVENRHGAAALARAALASAP